MLLPFLLSRASAPLHHRRGPLRREEECPGVDDTVQPEPEPPPTHASATTAPVRPAEPTDRTNADQPDEFHEDASFTDEYDAKYTADRSDATNRF